MTIPATQHHDRRRERGGQKQQFCSVACVIVGQTHKHTHIHAWSKVGMGQARRGVRSPDELSHRMLSPSMCVPPGIL